MTGYKFVFSIRKLAPAPGSFSSDSSAPMKANGWVHTARGSPMNGTQINWAEAYERRMRAFNLESVLYASISLVIFIILTVIDWWAFRASVTPLPRPAWAVLRFSYPGEPFSALQRYPDNEPGVRRFEIADFSRPRPLTCLAG
jgi:hypothetical protein